MDCLHTGGILGLQVAGKKYNHEHSSVRRLEKRQKIKKKI